MKWSDRQMSAGLQYIKDWLIREGYDAKVWDKVSGDGNWILRCISDAEGSDCLCCLEPLLQNAPAFLVAYCDWQQLHLDALAFVIEKAAETD